MALSFPCSLSRKCVWANSLGIRIRRDSRLPRWRSRVAVEARICIDPKSEVILARNHFNGQMSSHDFVVFTEPDGDDVNTLIGDENHFVGGNRLTIQFHFNGPN